MPRCTSSAMPVARSLKVSHYLARNGFEPTNVNGGMLAWAGAGRAIVTDDGTPAPSDEPVELVP